MWFRRDLRLADNLALRAAMVSRDEVIGLFVLHERLWGPAGGPRRAHLLAGLEALDRSMGGRLVVRRGDPAVVVAQVAREAEAAAVFASADFGPYGRSRDALVADALASADVPFSRPDHPYVVEPGTLTTKTGAPFKVFTPFARAWADRPLPAPCPRPANVRWVDGIRGDGLPRGEAIDVVLPTAGEDAAHRRLDRFLDQHLEGYAAHRDVPHRPTSHLSPDLKWGFLHPRQVLERVVPDVDGERFRSEVVWREFYAHVLFTWPASAREAWQPKMASMRVDEGATADARFDAWASGRTGYPLVDAGMRQLAATGWMHNRVRMVAASFLVKDLHIDWTRGARLFMRRLVDGDLASNSHGWQWVAGTGTDAAPYFRIFNPVAQAKRFDPDGAYVRQWVPELAQLPVAHVHEPWRRPGGVPTGYPERIVDHAQERREALDRLAELG